MKVVYEYGVDNIGVSSIKRSVRIGTQRITLHHTVRDFSPQTYWFSMWHRETGYLDFDIREWWKSFGLPEIKNWHHLSDKARLDTLAQMAEKGARECGVSLIEFIKKHSITLVDGTITEVNG